MNRTLGGILLVAGTTIGAGMLGLPVVTTFAGFWPSVGLFVFCWLLMSVTAFCLLDVNLYLGSGCNLISMAKQTLGEGGKRLTWIFYLLLLYSLNAAYLAGSTPFFSQAVLSITGIELPYWASSSLLPFLFGGFLYLGTLRVDYLNRILMAGLCLSYLLLALFIPPYTNLTYLKHSDSPALMVASTVLFTSFGYHIIIPSLTTYLNSDRRKLRKVILIGSAIPLVIYILWQFLIQTSLPSSDLILAWSRGEPATIPLAQLIQNPIVLYSAQMFSFFAIVTSFLGVSLSLSHFLMDGLKIPQSAKGKILALFLSFAPPLLFVHFYEKGFYFALQHAGMFVALLLGVLPACMAWKLNIPFSFYRSFTGKIILSSVILISLFVIGIDLFGQKITHYLIADYFKEDFRQIRL